MESKNLDPGQNYRFDYRKRLESKPDAMLIEGVEDVKHGSMFEGSLTNRKPERPRDR